MSRTIDQKVVEMRFDNSDFERNVSQSMSTLDKLKNALNFSGAEKSLSGISSAADKVDFGGLNRAVDDAGHKFSALEAIATGAFMRIGASISDYVMGKLNDMIGTVKSVSFDQISAGMDKYGQKTTAVQTIMNATGREIDDVSDKLATLNWFTDETSYDFVDMVNNIGKFTSQGIELEDAVSAMEGISTAAALAGQNAQSASRVMYNFSQALGMGTVKVQDWMSVENANMATQEFKQTIIDTAVELGRLDKYGNILIDVSKTYSGPDFVDVGNFRSTLAANWFDSEVLIAAMNKFGGFAGRLNEVYDQFNEHYDVTTSQILGWLSEYEQGTLDINDVVKKTGLTANEIIPVLQELSSEEYELGRRAFAAAQEAKTFEDVINATKDAVSTAWMNVFENIFGNYEEAKVMWTQLSNELWDIFAGPVSNLNDLLTDWHDMGGRDAFIDSVKNMYHAVRSYLDPIGEAWEAVFPPTTAERLVELSERFRAFTEGLIAGEDRMEKIRSTFEGVFGVMKSLGGVIGEVGKVIGFLVKEASGLIGVFTSHAFSQSGGFFSGISNALDSVTGKIRDFRLTLSRVRSAMDDYASAKFAGVIDDMQRGNPIIFAFVSTLDKLKTSMADLGDFVARSLNFGDIAYVFEEAGGGIAGVVSVIYRHISNYLELVKRLISTWTGIDISDQIKGIREYLSNWVTLIQKLQDVGWFERLKMEFLSIFDSFEARFGSILSWFKPLKDAIGSIVRDFAEGIGMIFGNQNNMSFSFLADGVSWLKKFVEESKVLGFVIETFKDAIEVISAFAADFLSLSNAVRVFQEAGGGLAGVLAVINDKLGAVGRAISDIVGRTTGLDLSGVGHTLMTVIQVIEQGVLRLADAIARVFGWEDNPFAKAIDDSNAAFNELSSIFSKFNGINLSGLSSLGDKVKERLAPLSEVFKGVGDLFTGFWNVIKGIAPILGGALSFIGSLLGKLGEVLKDMSFSDILSLIKTGVMIKLASSISGMFGSIGDAFDGIQKKMKAEAVHAIAVSILEIAAAMLIISLIPTEKVIGAIAGIGVALAGLIGAMATEMKLSAGADAKSIAAMGANLMAIGAALIEIAIAMRIMVKPISEMGAMESFGTGLLRVLETLGSITAALILLGFLNKSGAIQSAAKGIKTMAVAMGLFGLVLQLYARMDYVKLTTGLNRLVDAIYKIGGALAILTGLTSLLTGFNKGVNFEALGSGLKKVAVAIGIFALAAWGLSKMEFDEVASSIKKLLLVIAGFAAGFVILSVSMAISAKVLSLVSKQLDGFASAIWKIGKTVAIIFGVIAVFGIAARALGDSAGEFIDGAVNLIVMTLDAIAERTPDIVADLMTIIVGILRGLSDNIPVIVRLLIEILGNTFHEFKAAMSENDFNFGDLLGGGGLIGGMLLLVIALKKVKLGPKDFIRAGAVLAGCALLIAELGAFLALMGIAASEWNITENIKKFEKFASAIGDVFGKNGAFTVVFGVLLGGILVFALFLEKIKKKLDIETKDILKNIGAAFLIIGETIALAVAMLTIIGGEMAAAGWVADKVNMTAGIEAFKLLADAVASIFTGGGGLALLVLIAAVGAAGVFLEKIEKVAGTIGKDGKGGAKKLAGQIGQAALLIGEVIGAAVLLLSLIGGEMAAAGWVADKVNMTAGIEAFKSLADAVIGIFFASGTNGERGEPDGPLIVALLGLVVAIAAIGVFLKKIEGLAGAKGGAELMGLIGQGALIIGEILAAAVLLITMFGGLTGLIGDVMADVGVERVVADIANFGTLVHAILGLFFTKDQNGDTTSEPDGPVIALFLGMMAVISALGFILGKTGGLGALGGISGGILAATVTILEVIVAVSVIVGAMGLLFSAVGGLFGLIEKIPFIGEGGIVKGIEMFGDVLNAIAGVIGGFVGSLMGGIVEGFVSTAIPALADSLEYFGKKTANFFTLMAVLNQLGAFEALGIFAAAILGLVAASVIDGIGDWIGCGTDDFADNLEYFAKHAGGFFELMEKVGSSNALEGASQFADIVMKLTAASVLDGLTGWLTGGNDWTKFVDDLATMMPSFSDFVNNMPKIDDDVLANAKGIGEVLAVFAGADIPKTGGLVQLVVGEKDFGKFGTRIAEFGKGLKDFQDNTEGVEKDAIDKAATAAGVMIELSKELPSTGGLWQLIAGEKNFKKFGERLKSFGESLMEFQEATKDVDPGLISKAAICSKALVEINKALPNEGGIVSWFTGDNTFESFGKNLASFGTSLASYATSLESIKNWDSISDATLEIKTILAVVKDIAYIGQIKDRLKITDFGSQLKSFGASFKEYYDKIKDIDYDRTYKVSDSVAKIVTILSQEIPANSSNWFSLMNKNPTFMKTFGENLYSLSDYIVRYYERIRVVDENALGLLNEAIEPILSMIHNNIAGIERLKQGTVNSFGKALTTFGGFYLEFYNRIKEIDEHKANALSDALTETIAAFLWIDDQYLLDKINGVGQQVMDGILFLFGAEEIKRDSYAAADMLVEYLIARFEDEETVDAIAFAFFKMILEALSDQTLYEDMKGCGADIADTITEGITERMEAEPDGLKGKLIAKLREISATLESLEAEYKNAGKFLGNSIVKGITNEDVMAEASKAGENFSKGLANGIQTGQEAVNKAAKVVTTGLVKETKKGLDEHSPSDVAEAIGLFYDLGLENGLLKGMPGIKEKVDMVTGLIKNGTYDGLSDKEIWSRVEDLGLDFGSVFGDGVYDWIYSGEGIGSIGNFLGEEFSGGIADWLNGGGIDGLMESFSGEFSVGLESIDLMNYEGGYSALESYDLGYRNYLDSGNFQTTMSDVSGTVSDAFSGNISSNYENGEIEAMSYGEGLVSGTEAILPQVEAAGESIRTAFNKYALFGVGDTFGYLYEEMMKNPDGSISASRIYDFDTLKMEQAELETYVLDHFNKLDDIGKLNEATTQAFWGNEKFANFLNWLRAHPDDYGRADLVDSWEEVTVANGAASVSDVQLQNAAAEMAKTEVTTNDRLMEVLLQANGHLVGIREDISGVRGEVEQLERMNVVMDTGTLVGVLTPYIDEDLNDRTILAGRGVIG